MDDLLTTKQLQELLHVDRVTIYRMLKDGRLTGVKIGKQWRFPQQEVEALISGASAITRAAAPLEIASAQTAAEIPLGCIQNIQDVFAEIVGVGSLTSNPDGEPLTEISNCSPFCKMIQNSETGRQACLNSRRQLAKQTEVRPQASGYAHLRGRSMTCHAGLQCARAFIMENGYIEGLLIAGQFYTEPPESDEESARIQKLAQKHSLDVDKLTKAARQIPLLDDYKRERIGDWLERVANTFGKIGRERADMMKRLRHIAEVSTIK